MPDRPVTLEEIERLIAERKGALTFSPQLEAKFESETSPRRARLLRGVMLRTAFVYNLFLVADYFLAPDTFWIAVALHLLLVTPWIVYIANIVPSVVSPRWREGLAASAPLAIIAQIIAIFAMTRSPFAEHYFYLAPVTLISLTSLQRIDSKCVLRMSAIVLLMIVAALLYRPPMASQIAFVYWMTFAVCAAVVMNSNHLVAREHRRHYLFSQRDRLRAELSDTDANLDALTCLGNRRYLERRADEIWREGDAQVSVIMFDVDRFKSFNDSYGHTPGDSCLKRIAACATSELRTATDVAVRFGGEEFLLLLAHSDATIAEMVAERVRARIAGLGIPHEGSAFGVVTASFGVASARTSEASLSMLIEMADAALYAAKRAGRNQTRRCDAEAQPAAAA